jgi:hypothetical protein
MKQRHHQSRVNPNIRIYFDDDDRILKDGERLRVPLTMMDSMDPIQKAVARSVHVTDAQGGTAGLHRPGFRLPVHDAGADERELAYDQYRRALCDAYKNPNPSFGEQCVRDRADAAAERICPDCDGSGRDADGGESDCPTCWGTGVVEASYEESAETAERNASTHHEGLRRNRRRVDSRSVQQAMQDHAARMEELYAARDRELAQAWRGGKS